MKYNPLEARNLNKDEYWIVMYANREQILPKKVIRITKKFFYFDENNDKDRLEHYKFKNSEHSGVFISENAAWRFVASICIPKIELAKQLIKDYEFIKEYHPEALI